MNNKQELRVCPFCGGKVKIRDYTVRLREKINNRYTRGHFFIDCFKCSIHIGSQYKACVIKVWNTRVTDKEVSNLKTKKDWLLEVIKKIAERIENSDAWWIDEYINPDDDIEKALSGDKGSDV